MQRARSLAIWIGLATAILGPLAIAALSPLLAWRQPIYIIAGFAGIVAFVILLVQPLLAAGLLPNLNIRNARSVHRYLGALLVASVVIHVGGLWITSPPDVIDALTFTSPTPFSPWGVIAMWAVFAAATLATLRKKLSVRPALWRAGHTLLAVVTVSGTILHAVLIDGTMGTGSKLALCAATAMALMLAIRRLRPWSGFPRPKSTS